MTISPDAWFESPLGAYLLEREMALADPVITDIFGFNAVQLGYPQLDYLRMSRINHRFHVSPSGGATLRADLRHIPLASQSIDLAVLPHILEFSPEPHQLLREAERILLPDGQIVILGYNPFSLWGIRRFLERKSGEYPWCGKFIGLTRLKDWLALLNFEVVAGRLCCYRPPVGREKWLHRFDFMEAAGDRWWAMGGGVYLIHARKRVHGVRLILPSWQERAAAQKALARTTSKAANFH